MFLAGSDVWHFAGSPDFWHLAGAPFVDLRIFAYAFYAQLFLLSGVIGIGIWNAYKSRASRKTNEYKDSSTGYTALRVQDNTRSNSGHGRNNGWQGQLPCHP